MVTDLSRGPLTSYLTVAVYLPAKKFLQTVFRQEEELRNALLAGCLEALQTFEIELDKTEANLLLTQKTVESIIKYIDARLVGLEKNPKSGVALVAIALVEMAERSSEGQVGV